MKYICRMCGHTVKADPLKVPLICPKCNSLYSFIKIKIIEYRKKELSVKC